ncbi:MAG: SIS domain-containing protein [Candidatus Neomarinimicrobiota bacterium]
MKKKENDVQWLRKYFENYQAFLNSEEDFQKLHEIKELWIEANTKGNKIIFSGNGGSAAMSSHLAVDLTKTAKIRGINFNEADLITCFANDYGYENWILKAIEHYADEGDVIVLISSSGQSANIINGANYAKDKGLSLVTFSGFDSDNPLRQIGDINVWVNSQSYNIVEMTHHIWLLAIVDLIIG